MKSDYTIRSNKNGFSIWYKDRWILDASNFLCNGKIQIHTKELKPIIDDSNDRIKLQAQHLQ